MVEHKRLKLGGGGAGDLVTRALQALSQCDIGLHIAPCAAGKNSHTHRTFLLCFVKTGFLSLSMQSTLLSDQYWLGDCTHTSPIGWRKKVGQGARYQVISLLKHPCLICFDGLPRLEGEGPI